MSALPFISLFTITAYIIAAIIKNNGIPVSISDTYYTLKHPKWFTAIMLLTGTSLLPAALEASSVNTQFLVFLSVVSLAVTGLAPNFRGEQRALHYAGAFACLAFSQLWVGFNEPVALLLWIVYAAYEMLYLASNNEYTFEYAFKFSHPAFWAEITALLTTYLSVL